MRAGAGARDHGPRPQVAHGLLALLVAASCGRLGFDATAVGDADTTSDDGPPADTAPPFTPTTITAFALVDSPGSITKLSTDGTHLYATISLEDKIARYLLADGADDIFVDPFDTPAGLAVASQPAALYISARNATPRIWTAPLGTSPAIPTAFAGNGTMGATDGTSANAMFHTPAGLCSAGDRLYVTDRGLACSIRQIDLATGFVSTIAGIPGDCRHADGAEITNRITTPGGCVVVGDILYFSDTSRLRQLDLATREVTTLAGDTGGFADGPGTIARFGSSVAELTTDGARLYIADSLNHRVRTMMLGDATHTIDTLVGDGTDADSDGPLATAAIREPDGIVFADGRLFVASDSRVSVIQ